ncbi:MAG: GTPase Era [Bacteroidetes bacterium CG2_30_33_31]|nr:MAG: GTPase Era [Bacteroidetes bacterium CG2_30_33_31]
MSENKTHKAGFVNIIGNPNVGKSTLMNALVGENLSIITSKVQTTRHRILGIVNGDDFQMVYSDTPGIIKNPNYKLQEAMMHFVASAIEDADVFLYVTTLDDDEIQAEIAEKIRQSQVPIVVAINKIDLSNQDAVMVKIEDVKSIFPEAEILPISALHKFNIEGIFELILRQLPDGEAFYPKDELTDKTMRFFVSEIIREKVLLNYQKEVPYSVEVSVEEYHESDDRIEIRAFLYVLRESQKGIILGHQGKSIKKLGIEARKDIEEFVGKHVFLDLSVKVKKDWREDNILLKQFGYTD